MCSIISFPSPLQLTIFSLKYESWARTTTSLRTLQRFLKMRSPFSFKLDVARAFWHLRAETSAEFATELNWIQHPICDDFELTYIEDILENRVYNSTISQWLYNIETKSLMFEEVSLFFWSDISHIKRGKRNNNYFNRMMRHSLLHPSNATISSTNRKEKRRKH